MKINYILNGVPVNPVRREEIYLEINHDQESIINQPRPHVGINNLIFAREDVRKVMNSLNASPGITEGVPFDIHISERGNTEVIQMYLDLMDGLKRSNDGISATVKMLQSIDQLDDKVDGFTYESMYNEGIIAVYQVDGKSYSSYKQFFDERCIYVPYVISTIPNWQDAFMALFAMVYIGTQIYQTTKSILQWTAPSTGFGIVFHIAQLAIEIAYLLLLTGTLLALLSQLINCLIQPLKYHGAMLMTDLLKITAVKLGLQAQSSIWDVYPYNQIAFLPEKYNPVEGDPVSFTVMFSSVNGFATRGYTSPDPAQRGYFNGVGGDFLRLIKSFCNGKIIIPDQTNILQLERADYFPVNTPYQLPDIRQDWNGYNTDELMATMLISFIADLNDKNCIDKYVGTRLQATHGQLTITDIRKVCLKGLREINIQAARGINKTSLTFVERMVNDLKIVWDVISIWYTSQLVIAILLLDAAIVLLDVLIVLWNLIITVLGAVTEVINVIIDAINALPGINIDEITVFDNGGGQFNLIDPIYPGSISGMDDYDFSARINALLLENDMVDVPKLLLVDTSRAEFITQRIAYLHPDNQKTINAKFLWDKFYSIDAFAGTPNKRFTKITPALNHDGEKNPVMLSLADFKNLVSNPQFNDQFGEKVIADSIQWYIEKNGSANMDFRKSGWLRDPQNKNGIERAKEIEINLKLQITIPNGQ